MTGPRPDFPGLGDVSRETYDRLTALLSLLQKWNPAINLVSRATVQQAWDRHIADSAQIYPLAPPGFRHWADLGSGGGFPGLVIAAIAAEKNPDAHITLVDADQRKATFLRHVCSALKLSATVRSERIETLAPLAADVLSARALAPMDVLLGFARRHLLPSGLALLMKGEAWVAEVDEARRQWIFDLHTVPSVTDPRAVICVVKDIDHV